MLTFVLPLRIAQAQAVPAAERPLRFAVFATANGTSTGLGGGNNVGVTAGLDLDLPYFAHLRPALEMRATYPIDGGNVGAQRSLLGGLRLGYRLGDRLQPYIFGLFGRGRVDYSAPGYRVPGKLIYYTVTSSNVISGGGGLDVAMTGTLGARLDIQIDRQKTPVTATGELTSTGLNLGLIWRPRFDGRRWAHPR